MATYAITNAKALDGVTALLVGCLYRAKHPDTDDLSSRYKNSAQLDKAKEGEWCLSIISEPSDGRTVKANVEDFRDYLIANPLQPAPSIAALGLVDANKVIEATMPPYVPLADESDPLLGPTQHHRNNNSPTSSSTVASTTRSTVTSTTASPSPNRQSYNYNRYSVR